MVDNLYLTTSGFSYGVWHYCYKVRLLISAMVIELNSQHLNARHMVETVIILSKLMPVIMKKKSTLKLIKFGRIASGIVENNGNSTEFILTP